MRTAKIWVFSIYAALAVALLSLSGLGLFGFAPRAHAEAPPIAQCPAWPLPLPSQIGVDAYQAKLNQYVSNYCYQQDPKWQRDMAYRDTGFFIGGNKLGVHNSVRVYYSPELYAWMQAGEPEGKIPEGATVIKEMYPMPASQSYNNSDMTGLAIMVRDSKVAWDGWYWTDGGPTVNYTYNYPNAGYGLYCMNCHASTAKNTLTYSAINNVKGDAIVFNSTMPPNLIPSPSPSASATTASVGELISETLAQQTPESGAIQQEKKSTPGVHERRDSRPDAVAPLHPHPLRKVVRSALNAPVAPKELIPEYHDNVTQGPQPDGQRGFLTSNQCIGCHDATQNNSTQPNMVYPQIYNPGSSQTEIDLNVSPYSEWRASMMGLSGRDPIFFSQLETELNLHPEQTDNIVGTCLSCHGVMGQRQIVEDNMGPFKLSYLDLIPQYPPVSNPPTVAQKYGKYGALARDGVSCTVCHRITPEGLGTPASYTGKFKVGKPDEIYGPYEEVVTLPMKNGLGLTPKSTPQNQIRSSALCGSCHTVILPVLNIGEKYPGNPFDNPRLPTEHEQKTYLEWLNSKYQNERKPFNPANVQTCQDCHMPDKYPSKTGNQLQFKVASIEEDIFAAVEKRAADKDIHLQVRGVDPKEPPYSRHTLLGINLFGLEIFSQFSDTLGLVSYDPMSGFWGNPPPGLVLAKKSALDLARNETAQVEIASVKRTPEGLSAQVKVTNLAGHKFPSGVSFRRAFMEFRVDVGGVRYWVSGATNPDGVIGTYEDFEFKPLTTEFFDLKTNPGQQYQPHYETINRQDQAQIYEELIKDSNYHFTTSFLSLAHEVKDNRLMPQGWRPNLPDDDTAPVGVINDMLRHPNSAGYFNQSGSDVVTYNVPLTNISGKAPISVTATLYYQTIPPYYLQQRFNGAPDGVFTRSLMHYVQNLDVDYINPQWSLLLGEAPIKDWKLRITADSKTLK
ncbi:MAG: hypothetical protein QOF02_1451 [Blastocatellia bacterium]|jgi:cytochrome c553/mono/diheme cytochrome c family protein|nr:hypothetical protein [Blastocatellia bacterium]